MKFNWIPLSILSVLLFCLPAKAGKLVNWRFERNQNRIDLITDGAVQPQAQLIFNPTRLVIDLPGTSLGKPTERLTVGQKGINSVRVGQLDNQTTRIVIELAAGYTIEPDQVQFRGTYANQWSVTFPDPQPIANSNSDTLLPSVNKNSSTTEEISSSTPNSDPATTVGSSTDLRVTQSGLFIKLDHEGGDGVETRRSRDRRQIEFELEDTQLPGSLADKTVEVNRYGISSANFVQTDDNTALVVLNVNPNSPNWRGTFSRSGDFILLPEGGIARVENLSLPTSTAEVETEPDDERRNRESLTTIYGVQLINNQLVIQADGDLDAEGEWNSRQGVYEIEIDKAQLGEISNPRLGANSPVRQIRLQEPESDKVIVIVEPTAGVKIGQLIDNRDNRLLLSFESSQRSNQRITLNVPGPDQNQVYRPNPVVSVPQTSTQTQSSTVPKTRIVLVIDPGHGGKDPGTIGIDGVKEKDIVLPVSKMVVEQLEKQGIQVVMTRDQDYFVSLQQRADVANRADADLFISIHANAINLSRPDVNGLETYYFQSGQRLAQSIHQSILRNVNIKDRRVRRARFYVLRKSAMPAVLVEIGFLTGAEDSVRLRNADYQKQMAEAIALGIIEYVRQNR